MTAVLTALLAQAALVLNDSALPFAGAAPALLLLAAVSGAAVLAVTLAVASIVLGLVRPARRVAAQGEPATAPARQSDPRAPGRPQPRAPGLAA